MFIHSTILGRGHHHHHHHGSGRGGHHHGSGGKHGASGGPGGVSIVVYDFETLLSMKIIYLYHVSFLFFFSFHTEISKW